MEPKVVAAKAELTGQRAEVERRDQRPEAEPKDPLTRESKVVVQPTSSTSQQGVPWEDEGLQASSRGGAGGLAVLCGEDSLWGTGSGAMVGAVLSSSGSGSLIAVGGRSQSVGGSSEFSLVKGGGGLGWALGLAVPGIRD
ncbi:hypothetical protein DPX16_16356 [Anabarilius grahami]|uniref:Uncharacterized protein n=1 Tax=Anabarilius grahami TaxID=495550 RepID=A0A3N0XK61_ANAGA|nr:hypothetical protein DPX16_16356 [Anabarilius grahami]